MIVNLPTLMTMALPVVHDQQIWFHWGGGGPIFFSSVDQVVKKLVGQLVKIYQFISLLPFFTKFNGQK